MSDHDRNIMAALKAAEFVETPLSGHGVQIALAHLCGQVRFGDGAMSWSCLGLDMGGTEYVDQMDIDASAAMLKAYGCHKVREGLRLAADQEIRRIDAELNPPAHGGAFAAWLPK